MKKLFVLSALILATACSDLSQYTTVDANATARQKMQACMLSDANTRLNNGTLFTNSVSVTAKDIVNVCLKKLALESAGISAESQATATNIINNLKNLNTN